MNTLNDCDCCEGIDVVTPVRIANRPGLKAIACRVGTHADFKQSMLARLSAAEHKALHELLTRADDDFAIALLDAWAMVADVLTFYNERITQENYLRTAAEWRSLRELAQLIGYRPHPGLAAQTYLAFTVDEAFEKITLPAGMRVQSIPGQNEFPQTFETAKQIQARAEWNAMRPRLTQPQTFGAGTRELLVQGISSGLAVGDRILFVKSGEEPLARVVSLVTTDSSTQQTKVTLEDIPLEWVTVIGASIPPIRNERASAAAEPEVTLPGDLIELERYASRDLAKIAMVQGVSVHALLRLAESLHLDRLPSKQDEGVYAFQITASLFGHNALDWRALSDEVRKNYRDPPLGADWPPFSAENGAQLDLDRVYPEVRPNSWAIVIRTTSENPPQSWVARIKTVSEIGLAKFALSAKVTRITLDLEPGESVAPSRMQELRNTTVYLHSERLPLAEAMKAEPVNGHTIELDRYYSGLSKEQLVVISGILADGTQQERREVATIHEVFVKDHRHTELILNKSIGPYVRESLTISANVC